MSGYGAVVVGAGPAGALSALLLARSGVRTLLVEKASFPRYKVCGCCLAPTGQRVLERSGIQQILEGTATIDRLEVRHRVGRVSTVVPAYRVLTRETLDARLVELAQRVGVEARFGAGARVLPSGVVEVGDEVVRAGVVLCADGIGGSSLRGWDRFGWNVREASRVGVGCVIDDGGNAARDAVTMGVGAGGYCGVAPLGDGRSVLAAAIDTAAVRAHGALGAVGRVLEDTGMDAQIPAGTLVGVPTLTRTRSSIEAGAGDGGRIFVIGDGVGYIEPFTGEGMSWALRSAEMVRDRVLASLERSYVEGSWTRDMRRVLGREKAACRAVTAVLRRPRLTALCARAAGWSPALAGFAARRVVAA